MEKNNQMKNLFKDAKFGDIYLDEYDNQMLYLYTDYCSLMESNRYQREPIVYLIAKGETEASEYSLDGSTYSKFYNINRKYGEK